MVGWNNLEIGCPRHVWMRAAWWFAALLVCCGLLFSCGCKRKAKVYSNRANDAAYLDLLNGQAQQQRGVAVLQAEAVLKMTQCVQRVQAALPQDAGEDALRDALAADAEWLALGEHAKELNEEQDRILSESKKMIQLRMLDEQQARLDVEAGKAVAVDRAKEERRRR